MNTNDDNDEKTFGDYLDIEEIKDVINIIKSKIPLDEYELIKLKQKGMEIEEKILNIVRKQFSEAHYSINASTKSDRIDVFNIFDVKGTLIAYLWVDENGLTTVYPNQQVYSQRMN